MFRFFNAVNGRAERRVAVPALLRCQHAGRNRKALGGECRATGGSSVSRCECRVRVAPAGRGSQSHARHGPCAVRGINNHGSCISRLIIYKKRTEKRKAIFFLS